MIELSSYFPQIWETSEGWRANCPRCEEPDKEKKFYFNIEKNVGCCFHSTCAWFYLHGGVTARRAIAYLSNSSMLHLGSPDVVAAAPEADITLPEEFKVFADLPSNLRSTLYAYMDSRGIPRRIVDKAKLGYCQSGKMWGYIILPVFDDEGKVIYWQGRRFKDRTPKFYNPKSSNKQNLIYRISPVVRPRQIIIVESVINALTLETMELGRTLVIALIGKSLSDDQRQQVLQFEKRLKEIVIGLDGGVAREAILMAEKFAASRVPVVRVMKVPDGEDINSLGRQKSWELIRQAPIFRPQNRTEMLASEKIPAMWYKASKQ